MRIAEFLRVEAVVPALAAKTKPDVLKELAAALGRAYPQITTTRFHTVLEEREKLVSTGMERGVAIPHGRLAELPTLAACFAVSREGVDFASHDNQPSHFFFALVAPENSAGLHLKALSKINRLFRSEQLKETILHATTAAEIYALIAQEDARA
jgi:PTS system nitrogen regulatory IIA component